MTNTAVDREPDARDSVLRAVVAGTREAVEADPAKAAAKFSGKGTGTGSVATELTFRGHRLLVDEPTELGGDDQAPNPVEYALTALISCQVVTYRFWAAELGISLNDVEIGVQGDLDVRGFFGLQDGVRPGFEGIQLWVRLIGPESAQRYGELQRTVDEHCPVLDLFANPTPVSTTLSFD